MEIGRVNGPAKVNPSLKIGQIPESPGPFNQDTISKGEESKGCFGSIWEKMSNTFFSIWNGIKSFFRCVFCMGSTTEEVDEKSKLKSFCDDLDRLKTQFENNSKEAKGKKRDEFVKWWQAEFSKLDPVLQKEIILQDLQYSAAAGKLEGASDDQSLKKEINTLANQYYKAKGEQYQTSWQFVFELQPARDKSGNTYDPLNADQLPTILRLTKEELVQRMKDQVSSS